MIDTFYGKVRENPVLGFIFNDIAKVNWEQHLPIMYGFWSSIVLGTPTYSGNPMQAHIQLSKKAPMTEKEFSEWLLLFTQTVDGLFEGPRADEAKSRAGHIARLMLHKIESAA